MRDEGERKARDICVVCALLVLVVAERVRLVRVWRIVYLALFINTFYTLNF